MVHQAKSQQVIEEIEYKELVKRQKVKMISVFYTHTTTHTHTHTHQLPTQMQHAPTPPSTLPPF